MKRDRQVTLTNSARGRIRRSARSMLYSGLRPRIAAVNNRVHNHLYNCSTDASTNGELWLIDQFPVTGVFLDVGFNEGEWSRAVAERGASRTVHAFDPARSVIERHTEYVPPNVDFSFHPVALSNFEGRSTFHEYGSRSGSNSLADRHSELGDAQQYEVETTTLDAWASRSGIEQIEVLKIDAEGLDLNIMEGARALFERRGIGLVVFEYASGWFSAGRTLMEAAEFVESVGYDLYRLFPNFLVPYRYHVRHEGSAMTGYFVAINPTAPIGKGVEVRNLAL